MAFAERFLTTPDPVDAGTPRASFSVLHRSAMGAYLLVYSWTLTDVLELRAAVAGVPVLDCPDEDPTHFVASTAYSRDHRSPVLSNAGSSGLRALPR